MYLIDQAMVNHAVNLYQKVNGITDPQSIFGSSDRNMTYADKLREKDVEKGTINITGVMTDAACDQWVKEIKVIIDDKKTNHIIFNIDSFGGSVTGLNKILAAINTARSRELAIITKVTGRAYSAACVLAMAGDPGSRIAMSTSELMLHEASYGTMGKDTEIQEHVKRTTEYLDKFYDTIVKLSHGGINRAWFNDNILGRNDRYFSPDEAQNLKLIDLVVALDYNSPTANMKLNEVIQAAQIENAKVIVRQED